MFIHSMRQLIDLDRSNPIQFSETNCSRLTPLLSSKCYIYLLNVEFHFIMSSFHTYIQYIHNNYDKFYKISKFTSF